MKQLLVNSSLGRAAYRLWWERKYGVSADDVFLVSYPRSGNTWVRFMLLQARPGFRESDFNRIEEIIPDMHGPLPWFQCSRANVVKSHLTYWQPFRRVIYLVRDGRPATYSNWVYQCAEGSFSGSFDEFLRKSHWPCSWSDHVTGWVRAPETKLIVRYEDLVEDTVGQLERILNGIGWSVSRDRAAQIVANSTKEKMREFERENAVRLHRVGDVATGRWRQGFNEQNMKLFADGLNPVSARYLKG